MGENDFRTEGGEDDLETTRVHYMLSELCILDLRCKKVTDWVT